MLMIGADDIREGMSEDVLDLDREALSGGHDIGEHCDGGPGGLCEKDIPN